MRRFVQPIAFAVLAVATLVATAGVAGATPARPTARPMSVITCRKVVAVGDSVMLGAASALKARGVSVDAKVSRQFGAGAPLAVAAAGPGKVVVVHLGTNGPVPLASVERLAQQVSAKGARLVLVTIHLPAKVRYAYEQDMNARLWTTDFRSAAVRVADWDTLASTTPGLTGGDGIHLTAKGAAAYAKLVASVACR